MTTIFYAQFVKDKRKPLLIILFIVLSVLATIIFGGTSQQNKLTVDIFATGPNAEDIEQNWEELLNEDSNTKFIIADEDEAREQVKEGKRDVAILLMENDYRLITSSDMPEILLVEQHVHKVFTEEAKIQAVADGVNTSDLRNEIKDYLENPPITVQTENLSGETLTSHDMGFQLLFGFTLFIAMFTIGVKVNRINEDKVNGVWNRLLLSPVSKTNLYVGHLVYSFLISFFQMVVVFLIFQYIMDYDIGNFPMILTIAAVYTLSAVSLAMLIAGITRTPEKFNMIYPSLSSILPIISGVYMPPGMMDNPVFNSIANVFPLSHGVDAMMDVALFDAGWSDITLPIAIMLLIGVLYMGIGINLGERRR